MKKLTLRIAPGKYTAAWDAVAYEPFDGCAFVAQAPTRKGNDWIVAHRASTFISGYAKTRKAALQMATDLHAACPHAAKVGAVTNAEGQHEKLTGAHAKLRAEIAAFHRPAA